jgi:HEAT repeats
MNVSRHFAKLFTACVIAGLLLLNAAFSAEQTPSTEGHVEWIISDDKGSELLLEVRQMPLQRVLSTITAKTGVPIHYSVVPEGLVTATCVGATLKQIMECLLARKADLIVRYHKPSSQIQAKGSDKNQPVEMWVLGSQFTDATNCSGSIVSQQTINNSSVKSPDSQADAAVSEPDQTDDLLKSAKSKDAATRANAIGALMSGGRVDDAKVKTALEEALNDPNANVRAQAVSSLAHREGSAATAALQDALHDTDAGVRLMAVDGIGSNPALLQQAINDDDETVRNLAISKLEELQKNR